MKKMSLLLLGVTVFAASAIAGESPVSRFRMDCRFYDAERHYCVSSATYETCGGNAGGVDNGVCRVNEIINVRYGVLCDRQTVYNNEGVAFSTTDPGSKVEDHIRPITSSVPKTVILWQGALLKEGTYDANLELSTHKITNGSCDITRDFTSFD